MWTAETSAIQKTMCFFAPIDHVYYCSEFIDIPESWILWRYCAKLFWYVPRFHQYNIWYSQWHLWCRKLHCWLLPRNCKCISDLTIKIDLTDIYPSYHWHSETKEFMKAEQYYDSSTNRSKDNNGNEIASSVVTLWFVWRDVDKVRFA